LSEVLKSNPESPKQTGAPSSIWLGACRALNLELTGDAGMPNDAAEYRGYRIIWDVREVNSTGFWRASATIVAPRNLKRNEMIHILDGSYFASQEEATVYVIGAVKAWIDKAIEKETVAQPRVKKILIVEDHPDTRRLLSLELTVMGFEPITAQNGREGVEKALSEKPDLVLLDVMMPEMDGWDAARILRANPETKDIPILAETALSDRKDLNTCLQAGCDDYLVKPFTYQELRQKINAFITE
jgi:CheY-like chemotaxis protein